MAHMEIEIDHSVGIEPPKPEPVVKEKLEIPDKLLRVMKKYKYNWRLDQLSKKVPYKKTPKYVPKPDQYESPVPPEALTFECPKRLDHMARPKLRTLRCNKKEFKDVSKNYEKTIDSIIKASWNSMYNYYRRSEMELAARRRRRRAAKSRSKSSVESKKSGSSFKSDKERDAWMARISAPKPVPPPSPLPPRKMKPLSDLLDRLEDIAAPKPTIGYIEPRTYPIPIKKSALTYEMTEQMASLASKIPDRFKSKPEEAPPLGSVRKSALKYKVTPKIEKLAEHKIYPAGRESDLREDAFVISPNALKYKATPRILELAKPTERK